jgi:DNA-binding NtrC family response regulator
MEKAHILVVENGVRAEEALMTRLSGSGCSVSYAGSVEEALRCLGQKGFDLLVVDETLPDGKGLRLLERAKATSEGIPVIVMAACGTVQNAVEAMRKGAFDYVLKPFSLKGIEERIRAALEWKIASGEVPCRGEDPGDSLIPILTTDQRMRERMALCQQVASSKATVLIQGESGTGKELFARYLHAESSRRGGPFVAVNCASLPETLFESELFGHEKGAFTGALNRKAGKFELAHGGTILLDEITEMSPLLQAKILRVLQESEVDRIGGKQPVPVDVRVIATTNRDIQTCLEKGDLREDLYYRLSVITITLPPLRERPDDIELLANYFMKKFSDSYCKKITQISDQALVWLKRQPWRGNVRELKNATERAVLTALQPSLQTGDFNGAATPPAESMPVGKRTEQPHSLSLREMEKDLIFKALEQTQGNRTHAATILGISIRTLRNKLHEYKDGSALLEASSEGLA